MAIIWTKYWQGSDDGTVIGGIDLKNIQDDLSIVQTVNDALSIPGQVQGDVLYYNGSDWTRLASGTAGQVLITNGAGSNPAWSDLNTAGGSAAIGDILYWDGTNWVILAAGTAGDVLTSNGAGVAPSYQSISGASGTEFFAANGTFTAPAGVTKVYLTMVGGGGAGASSQSTTGKGGGGGGGGYIIDHPYTVTPAGTYTVVVGAGGIGQTAPDAGTDGLDSTFDGTIVCEGGLKGVNTAGGLGGNQRNTSATTDYDAFETTAGNFYRQGGEGGLATFPNGSGGGTPFGTGASGNTGGDASGADGVSAVANTGAGGSGSFQSGVIHKGGDGGSGFVLVKW